MSRFFSYRYSHMAPYTPGEQPQDRSYIKLNTNESPFPPSPAVTEALNGAEVSALNLYPDPALAAASEAIAECFGLSKDNVLLANGSDEILAFSFFAFSDDRR